MFDRDMSINQLLISLETVLFVEYSESMKIDDTLNAAIERIENTYAISLNADVFTLMAESELTANTLSVFMRDLHTALSQISMYIELKLYHKNLSISLSSVNYIGLSKLELFNALRYLQDVNLSAKYSEKVMPPIQNALDQIPLCAVKRLFCLLLLLDRLGVAEGVSILARLLYLGGHS